MLANTATSLAIAHQASHFNASSIFLFASAYYVSTLCLAAPIHYRRIVDHFSNSLSTPFLPILRIGGTADDTVSFAAMGSLPSTLISPCSSFLMVYNSLNVVTTHVRQSSPLTTTYRRPYATRSRTSYSI